MNLTILVLTTLICIMSIAFYKSYKENKHIGVGTVVFLFFFFFLLYYLISEIQFAFFYEEVEGTTISSPTTITKGTSTSIKYRYKYKGLLYYEEMPKPGYDVKVPNGRYTVRATNLFWRSSRIDFSKPLE